MTTIIGFIEGNKTYVYSDRQLTSGYYSDFKKNLPDGVTKVCLKANNKLAVGSSGDYVNACIIENWEPPEKKSFDTWDYWIKNNVLKSLKQAFEDAGRCRSFEGQTSFDGSLLLATPGRLYTIIKYWVVQSVSDEFESIGSGSDKAEVAYITLKDLKNISKKDIKDRIKQVVSITDTFTNNLWDEIIIQ